jgi:hypothetical protein
MIRASEVLQDVSAVRLPVSVAVAGLALASVAAYSQSSAGPDAAEIVRRSVAVNTADWKAQPEYSYCARYRKSKVDAAGHASVEQAKTFQILMIEGSPYERVIAIDNSPLRRDQQQQEQVKLNREIAQRQSESAAQRQARISKYESGRAEEHMLMQQMIEAFNFRLTGEQEVDGVDCYVLDARPNPAYQPPVQKARVLVGMQGRLWIDKEHYHWVKVQAEVINPVEFGLFVAKVKPGTRFELQQAHVGDVWLPKHFSESVNASVLGFYGLHSSEDEEFSDYKSSLLTAKTQSAASRVAQTVNNEGHPPTHTGSSEIAAR